MKVNGILFMKCQLHTKFTNINHIHVLWPVNNLFQDAFTNIMEIFGLSYSYYN